MLTYGDGVSDVPIDKLLEFHKKNKRFLAVYGYNERQGTVGKVNSRE